MTRTGTCASTSGEKVDGHSAGQQSAHFEPSRWFGFSGFGFNQRFPKTSHYDFRCAPNEFRRW